MVQDLQFTCQLASAEYLQYYLTGLFLVTFKGYAEYPLLIRRTTGHIYKHIQV